MEDFKVNKTIKLLLVSPYHPLKVGGISTWSKVMLDYCKERKDINLIFQNTVNGLPKRKSLNNVIFHFFIGSLDSFWIIFKLLMNLILIKPDIVHYTSSGAFALYKDYIVALLCKLFRTPLVVHWRFGRIPKLCEQKNKEYNNLIRVLNKISASIVLDERSNEALRSIGFENIYCIPNPISQKLQKASELLNIDYVQKTREEGTVLFVGHVIKTKGISELVKAAAITDKVKKLTIIGPIFEESYRMELQSFANEKDDGRWLNFIGELQSEDVFSHLQKCSIFCLPSYTEGFPNAVIEAMAYACPIVATNVGAIPEIINNNCGICIPPKDIFSLKEALNNLLSDKIISHNYGRRAQKKVLTEYTIENIYKQYYCIWYSLLFK